MVGSCEPISPPEGGNFRIDLGDRITEENMLTQCESNYAELLRKLEERMKEGDRVRVITSGVKGAKGIRERAGCSQARQCRL